MLADIRFASKVERVRLLSNQLEKLEALAQSYVDEPNPRGLVNCEKAIAILTAAIERELGDKDPDSKTLRDEANPAVQMKKRLENVRQNGDTGSAGSNLEGKEAPEVVEASTPAHRKRGRPRKTPPVQSGG